MKVDLVEAWLVCELDAELGEAGVDPGVAAVEVRVPEEAGVEDAGEAGREGPADSDAAAAVGHGEAVPGVLRRRLGAGAQVPGLAPVVLGERVEEVGEHEGGVVVGQHEPPRRRGVPLPLLEVEEEVAGDAGDADGGGEPPRVGVGEARGVAGDAEVEVGREGRGMRGGGGPVEEEEGPRRGPEPEAEQREAQRQRAAGRGHPEHHVRQRRLLRRRGRGRTARLRRAMDCGPERRVDGEGRSKGGRSTRARGVARREEVVGEEEEEGEEREGDQQRAERREGEPVRRRRHGRRRRGGRNKQGRKGKGRKPTV